MKLRSVHIENFRGVKDVRLDLQPLPEKHPVNLHAVMGDNGSGKTTILQAIALTLGLATGRVRALEKFPWYGFVPERVSTLGKTRVEIHVVFDQEEIVTTQEMFAEWRKHDGRERIPFVEPGEHKEATLVFEKGRVTCSEGAEALVQFRGRFFLARLARKRPDLMEKVEKVGDVFWYDQYRNLGKALAMPSNGPDQEAASRDSEVGSSGTGGTSGSSSTSSVDDPYPSQGYPPDSAPRESWIGGVEQLRRFLQDWWTYHVSPYKTAGRDFFPELEASFARLFPGTQFRGPKPMDDSGAQASLRFFFLLERERRVFDVAEMSSGEQAVFPLVCDFVRLNMRKSVVLIDELELHLHPPEQQALLAALPKMGPDCQFIVTTHSSDVKGLIPQEFRTRLSGGRLCL